MVAGVLACLYKPPVLGSPAGAEMLFIEGDAEEVSAVRLLRGYMLVQPASSPIDDLAAVHVFDLDEGAVPTASVEVGIDQPASHVDLSRYLHILLVAVPEEKYVGDKSAFF